MLLGVSIILGHCQVIVVVEPHIHRLSDFHSGLLAAQHSAGALAHAGGIADTVCVEPEGDFTFFKDKVVWFQTGTNIDEIDVFDDLFRAWDGLEVLALGNHRADHAGVVLVGDGLQWPSTVCGR